MLAKSMARIEIEEPPLLHLPQINLEGRALRGSATEAEATWI